MDIKARQYALVEERDEKINHLCVLCVCGFPRGSRYGTEHHEIISKAKIRGVHNLDRLYALPNIAMTCQYHHHHFQYLPVIWMKAMVRLDLASVSDYKSNADWVEKYPPFDCLGEFGYGDRYYRKLGERVPEALTMGIEGSGNFTKKFCAHICPFAVQCLTESRARYKTV